MEPHAKNRAQRFKEAGAKYVVLTSKHHEGFALWPSEQSWNWNAMDVGPHRDLCGDLSKSVKEKGLHMGFYYSLYEWFNPLYKANLEQYVALIGRKVFISVERSNKFLN